MKTHNDIEDSDSYGTSQGSHHTRHKSSFWNSKIIIGLCILVIVLAGAGFYFFGSSYKPSADGTLSDSQVTKLVGKVGKVLELPDEKPTGVVITDKTKLKAANLFSEAEDGDILLIFASANRAVIFRPSNGKIVTMANLNQTGTTTQSNPSGGLDFQQQTPTTKSLSPTTNTSTAKPAAK